jgi:hypothetical protein
MEFTGIILVGSVHFAWHHALDGYVPIARVLLIWWVAMQTSTVERKRSKAVQ